MLINLLFTIIFFAKIYEIIDEGIATITPRIITIPILSKRLKLLIAAIGPGVGGISVCELYKPPARERFKLFKEIEDVEAIDLDMPFNIKNAESQKTTVPTNKPRKFKDRIEFDLRFFINKFPKFFIELLSFKN